MKDGTKFIASTISEAENLPIHNVKDRKQLTLLVKKPKSISEIQIIYYFSGGSSAYLSCYSDNNLSDVFNASMVFLNSTESWYSVIIKRKWILMVTCAGLAGACLARIGIVGKVTAYEMALLVVSVLCLLLHFSVGHLFDRVTLEVGYEVERQKRKSNLRIWIFGTIFGGLLLALAGAVFKKILG